MRCYKFNKDRSLDSLQKGKKSFRKLEYLASRLFWMELFIMARPNPFMVKNWYKRTPDNFRFTAKFPKVITHDKRLKNVEKELEYFLESISGLEEKILALLIQLPPSLGITEGLEGLREIVPELDKRFRYAVEVRDSSWFQDLAYNFFANNNNLSRQIML